MTFPQGARYSERRVVHKQIYRQWRIGRGSLPKVRNHSLLRGFRVSASIYCGNQRLKPLILPTLVK